MNRNDIIFPFSAVVGQEQVKRALLLNAVSHQVGGVLITGKRGTAKSTLARGLADLLPELEVVSGCPFSCDPSDIESLCGYCAGTLALEGTLPTTRTKMKVVTLPLNATEEMVVGSLDIERAFRDGEKHFEPGILARANRSILYVDEVNLLEDHIVDVLLDSAAMGLNVVEREGISFSHGARFILVGTMNPEEGDLRPQLEDRFGLCADADSVMSESDRAEVLRRNDQFNRNPLEFESRWHPSQEGLRKKILAARLLFAELEVSEGIFEKIASIVHGAGADGHRADVSMLSAAKAIAALAGCQSVGEEHVELAAPLALNHRGGNPPAQAGCGHLKLAVCANGSGDSGAGSRDAPEGEGTEREGGTKSVVRVHPDSAEKPCSIDEVSILDDDAQGEVAGRRGKARQSDRGRYYRSKAPESLGNLRRSDIAPDATMRSAALRGGDTDGKPRVQPEDIRVKLRKRKVGASILFVVDASASMSAQRRLDAAREAILSLLVEAYQKRDRVGLVVFKDASAELVMSPTSSPALAKRLLRELKPGGTTPLSHGLALGYQVLNRELSRKPPPSPFLVLISDGGANVTMGTGSPLGEALDVSRQICERGIKSLVLDSAPRLNRKLGFSSRLTAARRIADAMGSRYFPLADISGEVILRRVHDSATSELGSLPEVSR